MHELHLHWHHVSHSAGVTYKIIFSKSSSHKLELAEVAEDSVDSAPVKAMTLSLSDMKQHIELIGMVDCIDYQYVFTIIIITSIYYHY